MFVFVSSKVPESKGSWRQCVEAQDVQRAQRRRRRDTERGTALVQAHVDD